MRSLSDHPFGYLRPANPVYPALLTHLLRGHAPAKTASAPVLEPARPIGERLILRAFSDELEKTANPLGWALPAMLQAGRAALPWAVGGELLHEGIARFKDPNAQHRTPLEIGGDAALSTLFHAPIATGLQGLGRLAGSAKPGTWSHWAAQGFQRLAPWLGLVEDPRGLAVAGAIKPFLETRARRSGDPAAGNDPSKPGSSSASPESLRPSYSELRKMDPRQVSSRYLS